MLSERGLAEWQVLLLDLWNLSWNSCCGKENKEKMAQTNLGEFQIWRVNEFVRQSMILDLLDVRMCMQSELTSAVDSRFFLLWERNPEKFPSTCQGFKAGSLRSLSLAKDSQKCVCKQVWSIEYRIERRLCPWFWVPQRECKHSYMT